MKIYVINKMAYIGNGEMIPVETVTVYNEDEMKDIIDNNDYCEVIEEDVVCC